MLRLTVVLVVVTVTVCAAALQDRIQHAEEYRASESKHKCETSADCQYNAYCNKMIGFCLCQDYAVPFEQQCLPAATNLGDKCSKSVQCTEKLGEKADCLNGECICIPGSHFANGACHEFVKIGQVCAGPSDCFAASGSPVSCKEGVCQCLDGYYASGDRSDCVLNIKLGEKCSKPHDCVADISTCTAGTCNCRNGFISSSDKQRCLPFINKLDEVCDENVQCTRMSNTVCRRRKCACKSGTMVHGGVCVECTEMGTFCDNSASCTIEKSECIEDICACKNGWVSAADNKRCIKVAENFYATCEEVGQCTTAFGDSAECKEGHCVCRPGYFFSEMKCLKNKVRGSSCTSTVECHITEDGVCQRMECKSGKCVCKQGFKQDPNNDQRCSAGVSPRGAGGVTLAAATCSLLFLFVAQILAM